MMSNITILQFKKAGIGVLIGLIIFIFLSALFLFGILGMWQEKLSDTLFTQRQPRQDILIIAIDDKSIQEIGRWPWDRSVYAKLLEKLGKNPPKVIGIDVSFLEDSESKEDFALAKSIKDLKDTNVVLAAEISKNQILQPIELLRQNATWGFVNTIVDQDSVTRRTSLWSGENTSFALEISKVYNQNLSASIQNTRINYVGLPNSFDSHSYSDVLNDKVDLKIFKDKIVLIGSTAPNLHDDQYTPVSGSKMSGVEIQANIIQTILDNNALVSESQSTSIFTLLIISILLGLAIIFISPVASILAIAIFVFLYILYVIFSFDQGIIRNIIYPVLAILLIGIANIIYKYLTESKAKKFIRRTFSYYLSETVLNHLLENPDKIKLGGERKELTVLFSDIAGFTSISESMQADKLAELLNNYLTKMTDVVFKNEGVLDKYIGDAVMAFWGAPVENKNHALAACKTALEMQEVISKNFDFTARVGINSGEMVVGNMGSTQRFDYSLLGDNVNLGSRLEGINKIYGTNICISQSTYDLVKDKVTARKLDIVAVKGKKTGVAIYELRHLGKSTKTEREFIEEFEKARKLYEKGEFKRSVEYFNQLNRTNPNDPPTKMYLQRIPELIKSKPSNWDGIYHATSK